MNAYKVTLLVILGFSLFGLTLNLWTIAITLINKSKGKEPIAYWWLSLLALILNLLLISVCIFKLITP